VTTRVGQPAPDITGGPWINSEPLTMEKLRGTGGRGGVLDLRLIHCKNVIPQLRDWHGKYEKDGLTIVGVHAPEFTWERPYAKVVQATKDLKVAYPVVQDNDFAIWKRFGNRYWPALVVIDRKGIVRYTHIGEGDYEETEAMIRKLLAEK
jgi:hypothetical protein